MDDLIERLITAMDDDHERGCQMRFVMCSCGYDDQTSRAVGDAKDRIEALQAQLGERDAEVARLEKLAGYAGHDSDCSVNTSRIVTIGCSCGYSQALKGADNAE